MASVRELTDPRPRSCWVEVDLEALEHNCREMQKQIPTGGEMLAVVKAEAYGHGAAMVSRTLSKLGVSYFGVATLEEALKLREFGIDDRLLIMGHTTTFNAEEMVRADLTPMIFSYRMLNALNEAGEKLNRKANIHLKIDTGMGRLGLRPEAVEDYIGELKKRAHVNLEGVATHFACAGEDESYTEQQRKEFLQVKKIIEATGVEPYYWHSSNSAAILSDNLVCEEDNLFRPGITLYGYPPNDKVKIPDLKPVMSLKSMLADYKKLPAGVGISYGRTFTPEEPTYIGVIPLGYADGYPREYSDLAYVLKGGQRKPVRGRVCMDMTVIELDEDDDPEEPVTLLGAEGGEELWAGKLAEWSDTITYEVLSRLSRRLPRVYRQKGELVAIKTERKVHLL